ncbi:transcriptional regulator KorA [Acidovorax sp. LjRoot129]|uniref:TrfB-related DNA-binding protein n=1 Tax=Acidovorax sp. LjRoot129 TaxID=3342260 RepID=UPI003ECC8960
MTYEAAVTIAEFEALQRLVAYSLSADRIEAARLVMVDGLSNQEAADRFGVTRQAIWKTVERMRETLHAYREAKATEEAALSRVLPRGWKRVTVSAPGAIVDRFVAEAEVAYQARMHQVAEAEAALRFHAERPKKAS